MSGPDDNTNPLDPRPLPVSPARIGAALTKLLRYTPAARHWLVPVTLSGRLFGEGAADVVLPFLSIRAFKHLDLRSLPPEDVERSFYSSGSTGSTGAGGQLRQGRHALGAAGLAAYRAATLAGYREFLHRLGLGEATPLITLVPPSKVWPDSSLAAMMHFLAEGGVPLVWSTPENLVATLGEVLTRQRRLLGPAPQEIIIFGTSLHHHLVNELQDSQALAAAATLHAGPRDRLVVVDTGGAKGKTLCLDPAAQLGLLQRCYRAPAWGGWTNLTLASEYGMCELASQAWSVADDLRLFVTSPTLAALSLDPVSLRPTAPLEEGLLAFIDGANTDSYPAILTEDAGIAMDTCRFRLHGRAPMASVKGCSLRVGSLPPGRSDGATTAKEAAAPQGSATPEVGTERAFDLDRRDSPRPPCFTEREWRDLLTAWQSCRASSTPTRRGIDTPRSLLIVSSANASIALLYPLWAAWESGYTYVTLSLPGVRDDDPLAAEVRTQIEWIAAWLSAKFFSKISPPMAVVTKAAALGPLELASHSTVLVFGSDETIRVYRAALASVAARSPFIGMGHVTNALRITDASDPARVAEDCLAWRGRGCLTPLILVSNGSRSAHQATRWTEQLATAMDRIHTAEFSTVPANTYRLFHWHSVKEILARSEQTISVTIRGACVVADARPDSCTAAKSIAQITRLQAVDPALAGQGLVFLLDEGSLASWHDLTGTKLSFLNPRPGYLDLHQGKTWRQWLAGQNI